jgi:hypothetical protein
MENIKEIPGENDENKEGASGKHKIKNQVDVDKNKTYDDDETINEDMKAGNPTGIAENEEGHWSGDYEEDDEKPDLP